MNELITRITSESPKFFKRIVAIGLTLGAIGTAIATMPAGIMVLPPALTALSGYFITAGVVAAAIAKTTVSDSSVLPPAK